ncbi:MAG: hypothetical protein ABEJ76_05480 [Halanaeroarchaeum sp.]
MADEFASSLVLASLDAEDAATAFGEDALREDVPPIVTEMVRSATDTRVWATTAVDIAERLSRGDFVVFHRANGVRSVAQVWSVSVDRRDVIRLTDLDDEALANDRWAVMALTNVQQAKDYVSLARLGIREVARPTSLYRIEDGDVLAELRSEFVTPAFLAGEAVENPLAFDVPPDGEAGPPPTEDVGPGSDRGPTPPVGDLGDLVTARFASRDEQGRRAGLILVAGVVGLAAAIASVAALPGAAAAAIDVTSLVELAVVLVGVGMAIAAGALLRVVWAPRPGLADLAETHALAADMLASEVGSATRVGLLRRLVDAEVAVATRLDRAGTWIGLGVATALLSTTVGLVYLAYGLAVQLVPSLGRLGLLVLVGVPWLVVATFLAPTLWEAFEGLRDRFEPFRSRER